MDHPECPLHAPDSLHAVVEPGEPICEITCPCCGASLDVTHGDDSGEVSVVGTPSEPLTKEGMEKWIAYARAAIVGMCRDDAHASRVLRLLAQVRVRAVPCGRGKL